MDWPVIEEKLESLRRCLRRVAVKCPADVDALFNVLNSAGLISADLALRMKKAVGFRNIAVHNYDAINC